MSLQWSNEATQAAADLMNEKSSLDYVLFTLPNPKQPKPEVIVESKGNGGRQAVFGILCADESAKKVLTGAFVASAIDEKGSVQSVRRKLVHVTFAGSSVGIITKGKLNGWSGEFRDQFPGCATYLQLMGGDLDCLQEGDLEATLMAAGGATRYDFTNQTLRRSLGLPEIAAPAPVPVPVVSPTKKWEKTSATPAPAPEPAPGPEPPKLIKTQTALQKMKAHKEAMRRAQTAVPQKASPVQEKEPTTPPPAQATNLPSPTNPDGRKFLMLLSTQSGSNLQCNNIRSSEHILKSIGVEPIIVDGADPQSKQRRDELFRLSGIRGNYPQFFVVQSNFESSTIPKEGESPDTSFFGDFQGLNEKNQNGSLAKDIGLGSDKLTPDPAKQEENTPAPSKKKLILLISSMCNGRVMGEQNHARAVIEGLVSDTSSQLELLDGCDQELRDRRNELWGVSGMRAQYPQLFTVDESESKIQFVGDYENIIYMHDHGSLAQTIGLSV